MTEVAEDLPPKVVRLRSGEPICSEAHQPLVELIETLLGEAKTGALRSLAVAGVDRHGVTSTSSIWEDGHRDLLLGSIELMKARFIAKCL